MSTRKQFEDWSANHYYLGGIGLHIATNGEYSDMELQHAWETWQASRSELVIKLPDRNTEVDEYDGWQTLDDCRSAIHASGVRTS